ncbi:MAG: hypothetical protein AAF517_15445 [Planctomycetota bacterium]
MELVRFQESPISTDEGRRTKTQVSIGVTLNAEKSRKRVERKRTAPTFNASPITRNFSSQRTSSATPRTVLSRTVRVVIESTSMYNQDV